MVHPNPPDLDRYPRYREALASAQVAEMEAGDALFIPPLWFHQVEALEKVNLLINYWWPVVASGAQLPAPAAAPAAAAPAPARATALAGTRRPATAPGGPR